MTLFISSYEQGWLRVSDSLYVCVSVCLCIVSEWRCREGVPERRKERSDKYSNSRNGGRVSILLLSKLPCQYIHRFFLVMMVVCLPYSSLTLSLSHSLSTPSSQR